MKAKLLFSLFSVLLLGSLFSAANAWERKSAPIMSTWGESINPSSVWQEYPRPQLVRKDWMNLNGLWKYNRRSGSVNLSYDPRANRYNTEILVPFCVESALSGVMITDYEESMNSTYIYYRDFTLPESFEGKDVLLHFGAVDWECKVYVNGVEAGYHSGGSDPFSLNITPFISSSKTQQLEVLVHDPTNRGGQPLGKQTSGPGGIWYTPVSGIWQTVWLEPVEKVHVERYDVLPDIDNGQVRIKVTASVPGAKATIMVKDGARLIAHARNVDADEYCTIQIPDAKLWSPDSPFLYDLEITLQQDGKQTDAVTGYFGMRKFSKGMVDGKPAFLLNNKPIYMYGPLDQGWWPDGLLTPPSYEAMVYDLEVIKSFGMNMVRKHIKVEPDLWYEWCDRNGLIVWQDMPNGGTSGNIGSKAVIQQNFYDESVRIVKALKQHPCIAAWVVYNEGWGQDAGAGSQHTLRGVRAVREADDDPYRLLHSVTGWTDFEVGDILDIHSYPAPNVSSNPSNDRVNVCGEFGGITLLEEGHLWAGSQQVYTSVSDNAALTDLYNRYTYTLQELMPSGGIWGSVYTQISDVEQEVNGLLTYDRKVLKVTDAQRQQMRRLIEQTINYRYTGSTAVVPDGQNTSGLLWRNTTVQPADNWYQPDFNDASWNEDAAGFGSVSSTFCRTRWRTDDIWLRRHFTLEGIKESDLPNLALHMYHDDDAEVYINGVKAIGISGHNDSYQYFPISAEALAALKIGGDNVMAIHCHQGTGGQFIDCGIALRKYKPCSDLRVDEMPDVRQPQPAADDKNVYLMTYQTRNLSQLHYAYSYDGISWDVLNGGRPVLPGETVGQPFMRYVSAIRQYVLAYADDSRRAICLKTSTDLVNWQPANGTDNGVLVRMDDAAGVSSPEFVLDPVSHSYYIFWTVLNDETETIYYVTTRDFKNYSAPSVLYTNVNGHDMTAQQIGDRIYVLYTRRSNGHLYMGDVAQMTSGRLTSSRLFSSEFPAYTSASVFPTFSGDGWLMYAYNENGHPILFTTPEGQSVNWRPYNGSDLVMPDDMRQGSVEIISRDQLLQLQDTYDVMLFSLLPTAEVEPETWRYTTTNYTGWMNTDFNDSRWSTGLAGFGASTPPNAVINTEWKTADIYLRHQLDLKGFTDEQLQSIHLRLHHDEDVEVYFNGVLALQLTGFTQEYGNYEISEEARAALRTDDTNVVAVHCHQQEGAQYIDLGIRALMPILTPGVRLPETDGPAPKAGVYNLQGQRLQKPQQGVNIVDGRKIIVR